MWYEVDKYKNLKMKFWDVLIEKVFDSINEIEKEEV